MSDGITIMTKDERTFSIAIPANRETTEHLAAIISEASNDGYVLVGATPITGGHQRDRIVTGIRMRFEKSA